MFGSVKISWMNSADGPRFACQFTPRLFSRVSPRSKVLSGQPFKSRGPFSRAVDFMVRHNNAMIHVTAKYVERGLRYLF